MPYSLKGLLLTPYAGSNRVRIKQQLCRECPRKKAHGSGHTRISQYHNALTIGVLKSNVLNFRGWPNRFKTPSPATDRFGIVRKGPILTAIGNFFGFRMNCDQASASERADVWSSLLVQCKVPCGDGLAPVSQNSGERRTPVDPVFRIVRIRIVWTTFGPVHLRVWRFVVNAIHPLRLANVSMPRNAVGVFTDIRHLQFSQSTSPEIVVMVDEPDFCFQSLTLKKWSQILADKIGLVLLWPDTCRHAPILVRIHFVLNRDGVDRHSFGFVSAQELQKIVRVRGHIFSPHRTAQHGVVCLHPSGRTPWRRK